jgi:hypothetical protein
VLRSRDHAEKYKALQIADHNVVEVYGAPDLVQMLSITSPDIRN